MWPGVWQLLNTLIPYAALWCLMYFSLHVSVWLALPLAVLAAGFLVRVFIIFHDCGHGSFFPSRKANDIVGYITGVLTLTPYHHWRWEHSLHHATSGDLDRRGVGRRLDFDGAGIPGSLALEAVRLSAGPEPSGAVWPRSHLSVRHYAANSVT